MLTKDFRVLEIVAEDECFILYRAIRGADDQTVLVKTPNSAYASNEMIENIKNENEYMQTLPQTNVINKIGFEIVDDRPMTIFTDPGGKTLQRLLQENREKLMLDQICSVAIAIVANIERLHQQQMTLNNASPSFFLLNDQLTEARLTNVCQIKKTEELPTASVRNVDSFHMYTAPEKVKQTLNLNSYQSDIYAVGVLLYEWFAKVPPYDIENILDIAYHHVATIQPSIAMINPSIPVILSAIIDKCMEKNPEERYGSMASLRADLEECLAQFRVTGRVQPFLLGRQESEQEHFLSKELIGRQQQVAIIEYHYLRAMQGSREMLCFFGEKGIGKTFVIQEALRKVVNRTDEIITVVCEEQEQKIAYSMCRTLIENMVIQLLTKDETELRYWKNKMASALEGTGQQLIDLVPQVQYVVAQKLEPLLTGEQSEQQLQQGMNSFMKEFLSVHRGFVVVVDNGQWMDPQSLAFFKQYMKMQNIFVVGAIRASNRQELPYLQSEFLNVRIEAMTGLDEQALRDLIAPIWNNQQNIQPILAALLQKTAGNPQQIIHLLESLKEKQWIQFNRMSHEWEWAIDDIVSFLTALDQSTVQDNYFLDYLQTPTISLLKKAAIAGQTFYLATLQKLTEQSIVQLQHQLKEAVKHHLLLQQNEETYTFQSVATQQFFYQLITDEERQYVHMEIGRIFAEQMKLDQRISSLDVLKQWQGLEREVVAKGQSEQLLQCYLLASQELLEQQQNEQARHYVQNALLLLGKDCWVQQYETTFLVYEMEAELAIRLKQYEHADELLQILLNMAKTQTQTVQIYLQILHVYLVGNRFEEVYKIGLNVLAILNCPLKLQQSKFSNLVQWLKVSRQLGTAPDEHIRSLPMMTDTTQEMVVKVLVYMANAIFLTDREAWLTIVLKIVNLTVKHGLTAGSAYGFVGYGLVKSSIFQQFESAYHYREFAVELVPKHTDLYMQVNILYLLCHESWRKYDPHFLLAFTDYMYEQDVFSDGNWYVNYNFLASCGQLLQFSYPLGEIHVHLTGRYATSIEKELEQTQPLNTQFANMIAKLTGNDIPAHREQSVVMNTLVHERMMNDSFINGIQYFTVYIPCYLFGQYEQAYAALVESMNLVEGRLPNEKHDFIFYSHCYYYVLVVKELFLDAETSKRKEMLKSIKVFVKRFRKLANKSPESYLHKYYLMKAEQLQLNKKIMEAEKFYVQALSAAQKYEHIHDMAIIAECMAKYYRQRGESLLVKIYLNEAYEAYQKWGATAKAMQLAKEYPDLLLLKHETDLENTDYMTIMKSAQALSEEIKIDCLLHKLLIIMLQNAGAEYGALIFNYEGQWQVEAYGTISQLIVQSIELEKMREFIPTGVIEYTARTNKEIVLQDAMTSIFSRNTYIKKNNVKSVLSLPIIYQNRLLCVLYMENNLSKGVFTEEQLDVLRLLCSQCAISITNARLFADVQFLKGNLEQKVEERTDTLQKSMQATSEALAEMTVYAERNRIAQEIHDIVGHTLTSTILQIEAGRRLLSKDLDGATVRLKEAQDLVRHSLSEIRNSVHMLKEDKYYDVEEMLHDLVQDTIRNTGVLIYRQIEPIVHVPLIMKKLIYHALQEGLTNGIRHGQSTIFYVDLKDDGKVVHFILTDNGQGADPLILGFGLKMMQERVRQLRGTFHVTSALGKGCTLEIQIPYLL